MVADDPGSYQVVRAQVHPGRDCQRIRDTPGDHIRCRGCLAVRRPDQLHARLDHDKIAEKTAESSLPLLQSDQLGNSLTTTPVSLECGFLPLDGLRPSGGVVVLR